MSTVEFIKRLIKIEKLDLPDEWEKLDDLQVTLYGGNYNLMFVISSKSFEYVSLGDYFCNVALHHFPESDKISDKRKWFVPEDLEVENVDFITKEIALDRFEKYKNFYSEKYSYFGFLPVALRQELYDTGISKIKWKKDASNIEIASHPLLEKTLVRFPYEKGSVCRINNLIQSSEKDGDITKEYVYGNKDDVEEVLYYAKIFMYSLANIKPDNAVALDHLNPQRMWDNMSSREIWCYLSEANLRMVKFEDRYLMVMNGYEY